MNKSEKKAKKLYDRNKLRVSAYRSYIPPLELSVIAVQQDRLYKVIHRRQDSGIFNE